MLGRSVEPRAGEGSDAHAADHLCGQHEHVQRAVSAFIHDILHGVLHFEGKIWQSLAVLERFKREGITNAVPGSDGKDGMNVRSSIPWLNEAIQKAKANPQLMVYKVQSASYNSAGC